MKNSTTLSVAMTEDEAGRAWGMRSHLSHGSATGKLKPAEEEIYKKLEKILRGALKKANTDDSFALVFAGDSAIRSRWPIIIDGRSI
jgi:hypothetical protein